MQLDASLVQKLNKPERWSQIAALVLTVISLFLLAKLIWLWVDAFTADYEIQAAPVSRAQTASQPTRVSVDAIVSKHLFGDADAKPQEEAVVEVAATETRLPLKLRGIYAFEDEQRAAAIIEAGGGDQEVYFIGDKVNGGSGATLHQVLPTKVILNRAGQLESLTLEQEESVISMDEERKPALLKTDSREGSERVVVDNPRIQRDLSDIKRKLEADPSSIQDMLRWEPVMENGMLQGVKISPGKERRLFNELKLRRNDIVTNINGIALNDPGQLLMLKETLSSAREVSLSLLRNGEAQEVVIRLDERSER